MKHQLVRWALVAAMATPTLARAELKSTNGETSAAFHAVGPAGLSIDGKTNELEVVERNGVLEITVRLAKLDTGISLRNKHMTEKYLEVQKYPVALLKVQRSSLNVPAAGASASGSAQGQMTIHGVTKPVAAKYTVKNVGGRYAVEGTVHLNMRDFGVEVPSYLGVTVKPEIDVAVKFSVVDQQS